MPRVTGINEPEIRSTMQNSGIQSVSIAAGKDKNNIASTQITDKDSGDTNQVIENRIYGAASLSKPVFTYLVLKLIDTNDFKLDTKLQEIYPFQKFCEKFGIEWDNSKHNIDRINQFTPDMILSHQTGLPIGYRPKTGPIKFDFEPGQGFAYSGIHLMYLQECLEIKFGHSLEELAKKHVFEPAKMNSSTFNPPYDLSLLSVKSRKRGNIYINDTKEGLHYEVIVNGEIKKSTIPWDKLPADFPKNVSDIIASKKELLPIIQNQTTKVGHTPPANAANSLFTTAEDYARFCLHMMQDPDPQVQNAFESKVSMLDDPWAVSDGILPTTLDRLAWGYGWGLEKDKEGNVISAFHTGDMGEWRAGVQLDLRAADPKDRSVKVFLSESSFENGHLLQEQIFGRSYALDYFFDKFKFARTTNELKDDWREEPSHGLRKESVKNELDKRINSTSNILAAVSSNPAEAAKQMKTPYSTPKSITPEKSPTQSQEMQQSTYKSPTPYPTKPTPKGTSKN